MGLIIQWIKLIAFTTLNKRVKNLSEILLYSFIKNERAANEFDMLYLPGGIHDIAPVDRCRRVEIHVEIVLQNEYLCRMNELYVICTDFYRS